MTYQTEFPGFPPSAVPALLLTEDWRDASWGNDVSPFFIHEASGVAVWVNHPDDVKQEGYPGFAVVAMEQHDGHWGHRVNGDVVLLETDDWAEVDSALPGFFLTEGR